MPEFKAALSNYRNILGDAKETINAIQRFIEKDEKAHLNNEVEETPAASINKILNSTIDKETCEAIQLIISKM